MRREHVSSALNEKDDDLRLRSCQFSRNAMADRSTSSGSRPSAPQAVTQLRDDAVGVVVVDRALDAIARPCNGELMLADLGVGRSGGVV